MKLKDIAQQAGVSISTVSRVLRSPDTNAASKEVRDRIWKIVRETGYLPNETARALKSGKETQQTQTAQSIYCLIATSPEEQKDDAFYTRLITSIEYDALKSKYILRTGSVQRKHPAAAERKPGQRSDHHRPFPARTAKSDQTIFQACSIYGAQYHQRPLRSGHLRRLSGSLRHGTILL